MIDITNTINLRMVVYNSLIADVSPECIGLLDGPVSQKLVTLQLKLEKHYPDVVVQSIVIAGVDVFQIKGCWDDIKGIHILLEKLMKDPALNQANKLCVKTEPTTGLTDDEEVPSNDEGNNDSYKDIQEEKVSKPKSVKQKTTPRRKVRRPRKRIPVKEEPYVSSEEEVEKEDLVKELYDVHVLGTLEEEQDGKKKDESGPEPNNYDSDTEYVPSDEENDNEMEKDEDWEVFKKENAGTGVKMRKRRFKRDESNLIDPENIDKIVNECIENANSDNGNVTKEIPCMACDYKSPQRRLLKVHILRCHSVHKKQCPVCNATFGLNKDLNSHLKNHAPKIPCTKCKCKFVRQSALNKHIEQCHSDNPSKTKPASPPKKEDKPAFYKCEQCNYITEVRRYLKHHVLRNHKERQHKCSICNKLFGLEKDLRQHMKNHTDANCVQCEECGKTLRSKFALHLHINSIHRGIKNMYKKEYVCDHCGKVCANKTVYSDHINKDHLNVKRFGCPICPMTFFTKYNLRHHLITHSSEKNYSCETCGKDFKRRASLRIHQRIHETVRLYTCQTCNKSFHQQGALKRHERIHTGEKPYKCSICSAAFTDYSILRRHLMGIHKQDKSASKVHLRKAKSVEGVNRGGEKRDTVTVHDISKYKGVFRGVEEYVHFPEEGIPEEEEEPPTKTKPQNNTKGDEQDDMSVNEVGRYRNLFRAAEESYAMSQYPETDRLPERLPDEQTLEGVEKVNRVEERHDSVEANKYREMFSRGVSGYINYPEDGTPPGEEHPPHLTAEHKQQHYSNHHHQHHQMGMPLEQSNHSSVDNNSVDFNIRQEHVASTSGTPLPQQLPPEQSMTPVPVVDSRHIATTSSVGDENQRMIHPPQINFSNIPFTSLPEVLNPAVCLSSMQYSHGQRPDFNAMAGALLQAAQHQQAQQQHQLKGYDGHLVPHEGYYYQNHPL